MIYFIIGDTLVMIYLFYYLYKKLNKINSKPESKKTRLLMQRSELEGKQRN